MKVVLASNNAGKLREFSRLLAPMNYEVIPQGQLNVPSAEEPFFTFLENCLAKARHAARITGLPAIADDSGICAEALGGAPGVFSARFAGEPCDDQRNNELLVEKLQGQTNRRAHYTCVLVAVRHADDPEPIVAEGRWYGEIIDAPRGTGGFGYDPVFFVPQLKKTFSQLSAEEKNAISHRGKALEIFMGKLEEYMK